MGEQALIGAGLLSMPLVVGTALLPGFWTGRSARARAMEANFAAAWAGGERSRRAILRSLPTTVAAVWAVVALVLAASVSDSDTLPTRIGAVAAVLLVVDVVVMVSGRPRFLVPPRHR